MHSTALTCFPNVHLQSGREASVFCLRFGLFSDFLSLVLAFSWCNVYSMNIGGLHVLGPWEFFRRRRENLRFSHVPAGNSSNDRHGIWFPNQDEIPKLWCKMTNPIQRFNELTVRKLQFCFSFLFSEMPGVWGPSACLSNHAALWRLINLLGSTLDPERNHFGSSLSKSWATVPGTEQLTHPQLTPVVTSRVGLPPIHVDSLGSESRTCTWSSETLPHLWMVYSDLAGISSSSWRNPICRCIRRYHFCHHGRNFNLYNPRWVQEHDDVLPLYAWNDVRLSMLFRRLGFTLRTGRTRNDQFYSSGHWSGCDNHHQDYNAPFLWPKDGWSVQSSISHDVDESNRDVGLLYDVWLGNEYV